MRTPIAALLLLVVVRAPATAQQLTDRVNVASGGAQSSGQVGVFRKISADGSIVAFESTASDLVPGDTNGLADVFVHNRRTGTTSRVSVGSNGAQADRASTLAALSDDGRFVLFNTLATNLGVPRIPGTNRAWAYLHDRQSHETSPIPFTLPLTHSIVGRALSRHARYVLLYSSLVDLVVVDRQTGATTRVDLANDGSLPNGALGGLESISADGRYVALVSFATNLVAGDTNGVSDVFIHDRQTRQKRRVSAPDNVGASVPVLSADGRYVLFRTFNSVAPPGLRLANYRHDQVTGQTIRVEEDPEQGGGVSMSGDGRYIAFDTERSDLVSGDTNLASDVFARNLTTGSVTRVSVNSAGEQATWVTEHDPEERPGSGSPVISADGGSVLFISTAENLVPVDTNRIFDLFVRGLPSPPTELPPEWEAGGCFSSDPLFFRRSVHCRVRQGNLGPALVAWFTPENGCTLQEVATLHGFHHFNWVQVATNYPLAWVWGLQAPFIDPPPGGYPGGAFADDLPFYWDEGTDPRIVPANHRLANIVDEGRTLLFADSPRQLPFSPPAEFMTFETILAGVYADNTWRFLDGFQWSSNYNGEGGGVLENCAQRRAPGELSWQVRQQIGASSGGGVPWIGADQNVNGLDDSWEALFGVSDGAADPDGDGLTNRQEFEAGTHPRGSHVRYFAEGATGTFFGTRLALLNTTDTPATVVLRFLNRDGRIVSGLERVGARTRATLDVQRLAGMTSADFSTVIESDQRVVADRVMSWDGQRYGSHAETSLASPSTTWYLAEGSTAGDFALFYLLQNPNPAPVEAVVRYLLPFGAAPIVKTYSLLPNSRTTIAVDGEGSALAATDVSAAISASLPIIVERAMYAGRGSEFLAAGHDSAGVTTPASEWFLAEGATGPFFDLFILLANPNPTHAMVTADYLLLDGTVHSKDYVVPANGRFTIWVDAEEIPTGSGRRPLANVAVSTRVRTTNGVPIIVERTMWWPGPEMTASYWTEAHNSPGSTETGIEWALAEGEVGGEHGTETYILIANTSAVEGSARVRLFFEDGTTAERVVALRPTSRTNVAASSFPDAAQKRFGAIVESLGAAPARIVVERAMYSNAGGVVWAAGTNALATKLR